MIYDREVATDDKFDLQDHSQSADSNKNNPPGYDESNKQKNPTMSENLIEKKTPTWP